MRMTMVEAAATAKITGLLLTAQIAINTNTEIQSQEDNQTNIRIIADKQKRNNSNNGHVNNNDHNKKN